MIIHIILAVLFAIAVIGNIDFKEWARNSLKTSKPVQSRKRPKNLHNRKVTENSLHDLFPKYITDPRANLHDFDGLVYRFRKADYELKRLHTLYFELKKMNLDRGWRNYNKYFEFQTGEIEFRRYYKNPEKLRLFGHLNWLSLVAQR